MENNKFSLNPNRLVQFLKKEPNEFTREDIIKFIKENDIRMINFNYLNDWKKLLDKFKIYSHIGKDRNLYNLVISGWEDFNKLQKLGLCLFHSKKSEKFNKILNTYKVKQISRDSWKRFYINKLKEVGRPVNAAEFAKILDKSKRVVNHHLTRLDRKSLIKVDKTTVKYLYSV